MNLNQPTWIALRKSFWLSPPRLVDGACYLLFAVLAWGIQYGSGAFSADLAFDWDEPAHAVSSLMVRDYVVQAFPRNPIRFAWDFYAHYPKIAIGHWPPLFYFSEALWMLLVGRSQTALLLLVAIFGAILAGSIFYQVRRRSSLPAALVSVAVLMSSRMFQQMLCGVRPDILMVLLIFWAAVHCGEFMRFGSRKSRNLFVMFSVCAVFVHGRAAFLLLLPFVLLPLRPRFSKWKWTAAGVVVMLLMLLPPVLHQAPPIAPADFVPHGKHFVLSIFFLTGWPWTIATRDGVSLISGWPCAVLAIAGLLLVYRKGPQQQFWAAMAGIVGASLIFYLLVPVPAEQRFLLTSMMAVAVLAGGGAEVLLQRFSKFRLPVGVAFGALAVAWILFAVVRVEAKPDLGYRRMVKDCLLCGNGVTLIAGDEKDEGGLIVEASLADPHREHTVLRASKSLASSNWMGNHRRLTYSSIAELLRGLDRAHVSLVIVQKDCDLPQVVQLRTALAQDKKDWRLDDQDHVEPALDFYRRNPADAEPAH